MGVVGCGIGVDGEVDGWYGVSGGQDFDDMVIEVQVVVDLEGMQVQYWCFVVGQVGEVWLDGIVEDVLVQCVQCFGQGMDLDGWVVGCSVQV